MPTTGRQSLGVAVESALNQLEVATKVIIIVTGQHASDREREIEELGSDRVKIHFEGRGKGAAELRALGTKMVETAWVAYLDDDDVWFPTKVSAQLKLGMEKIDECLPVISCRTITFGGEPKNDTSNIVSPKYTYQGGDVARYLFYRRRLNADRNLLHTSTLLLRTSIALEVPWRHEVPRHQDWDFVIRLSKHRDVKVFQLDDVLVATHYNSPSSISRSSDWASSLWWAKSMKPLWDTETYQDFIAGQPLRYAIQARSLSGIRKCVHELKLRPLPTSRAILLAISGLLPPNLFGRLMHRKPSKAEAPISSRT